jgi:ubiquitin-conjugating enzyme E2 S
MSFTSFSLMIVPMICHLKESALNEEAGRLLLGNYEEYARHARLMTSIHAPKRPVATLASGGGCQQMPLTELTSSGANNSSTAAFGAAGGAAEEGSSPVKKAKGSVTSVGAGGQEQKPAAVISKVKKSLKRL